VAVRALISTDDKTGLAAFARGLAALDVEIVASGGTAGLLEDVGLEVIRVESLTSFPEMLGGRVKTLHPRVHAGILARRDVEEDVRALEEQSIEPFDLVCVNLYPFESAVAGHGVSEEQAVELIDIGGPALLRGAAKNFAHCAPVCRPEDYDLVLEEIRDQGEISPETRRTLAMRAFAATAAYEAAIARWFAERETFPETLTIAFDKVLDLEYGENPHQRAAYYGERGARSQLLSRVEQLHGKPLTFNNLNDLSAARLLLREFQLPACAIVKHANPCGVAVAATIEEAYAKALAADPVSAFGGVVVLNRPVSAALGISIAGQFVEVLFAPGFDEQATEVLVRKPAIRILNDTERRATGDTDRDYRRVLGGMLVQDRDWDVAERDGMELVCGELTEQQWGDLLFAWRVAKHVDSNAIVLAKELQTIGIGAGQMSRVDAVRIALAKAAELGHDVSEAVLASDGFFPFADGPQLALDAGVKAIMEPGGSKRDDEVIQAVESGRGALVFTHRRHFRH
jgi:phosphoribosylaminoimidazolecarboxamide formyltransferase/IMP cyclohydrolase